MGSGPYSGYMPGITAEEAKRQASSYSSGDAQYAQLRREDGAPISGISYKRQ